MDYLKKELYIHDKVLNATSISKVVDKTEYEEFEMALQCKSKLCLYMELKWVVVFEEYLELVKGVLSRMILEIGSGTQVLFEELGRHANRGESQDCPKC